MSFKKILLIFGVLFFSGLVLAGNIEVSSTSYDPVPAIPGSELTVWVNLQNNSNGESKDVVFNLNLKSNTSGNNFPFSLVNEEQAFRNLGTFKPYQTALLAFKLLVDASAPNGNYTIQLETGEDGKIIRSKPLTIQVLKRKPSLMVVSSNPLTAEIGKIVELELVLKNTGNSNASNITIGLAEDRTITSTGVVIERDIVPLGAAFTNIQSLAVDETASAKIPLIINPSATAKAYYVPLTLTFYDDNKSKYSQTEYVGLKVVENAEIGVSLASSEPLLQVGKKSKITIDIFNTGNGTAKFLTAKVKTDFLELEQSDFFIGSLEPDDSDSIILSNALVSSTVKPGIHELIVEISFKNDFGETFTVQKQINVKVYSSEELAKLSENQTPWLLYLIALLLIVGVVWFYRKKGKKAV